jgi:hypothetical protein
MRGFRSVTQIIDRKSIAISALSVLSTWLCLRFGITADFPLTLIATAIVFPLVFSIGTAYKRREKALEEYGSIKAHGRALYLAGRDWLPEGGDGRTAHIKEILGDLLHACRELFTHPIERMPDHEQRIYAAFSRLSLFVEGMRSDGLVPNECSRCNQYVSRIMVSFENIKHIYQYRTPRSLRAFSDFFILILPILYGPYFAFEAGKDSFDLFYLMPILFTVTLVGLANIQDHLENPFDQIGDDDVAINAEKFIASLRNEPN